MEIQITEEHLNFLNNLKKVEHMNAFRASSFLRIEFPKLTKKAAQEIVNFWIKKFNKKQFSEALTDEWCPECNTETTIPVDKVSVCPVCGNALIPCSACPRNIPDECDWQQGTRCSRFPL